MDDAPACVGRGTPPCGEKPEPSDAPASMGGWLVTVGALHPSAGRGWSGLAVAAWGGRAIFVLALACGGAAMP